MKNNNKNQKNQKDKFKQGCVFIFKKWSAFRLALDNNPRILTYYNEDKSVLEINEMLQTLYEELYSTLNSGSLGGESLINELSDILYGFMSDYFNIALEDQSDIDISEILVKLYNELKNGTDVLFNKLQNNKNNMIKYNIEFPILGNQTVIFEKTNSPEDEEEEDEDDNMDVDNNNTNNNKGNNEDEDGFIEVKKGKGF